MRSDCAVAPGCRRRADRPGGGGTEGGAGERPPTATYYETATVRARSLDTATASVQVIDRDDLADLAAGDAAEALRLAPGAFILGNDSSAALAGVSLRGGDANFTLVLIDGVPDGNDSTDQYGGAFPLGSIGAAEDRASRGRARSAVLVLRLEFAGRRRAPDHLPRRADRAPFLWAGPPTWVDHDHRNSGRLSWGRAGESSDGRVGRRGSARSRAGSATIRLEQADV